ASVVLNLLLLYAIRRFTKKSLGAYKQLLTIFAAFDIFLTLLHAVVKPKVVIIGTTFGVGCIFEDRRMTSFYCSCFTVPFALMVIHFIYRFWSIRHPDLISLFSNKKFIAAISLYPVMAFVVWIVLAYYGATGEGEEIGKTFLREEYRRRYGLERREGWLIMNHWENESFNVLPFVTLFCVDVIMVMSFSTAATLGGLTFYYINQTDAVSLQSHNLQLKLFIAVTAQWNGIVFIIFKFILFQTLVPLVFVYIPYICVINFPFFRLPIFYMDDACMVLTSCFPAWDAVIMIMLIKDYR
ncbi:hypothetical protein PENTCL1PPCAC_20394, partial [Pristionchus entomophagus]